MTSRYGHPITATSPDQRLDLFDWVGQRTARFRFELTDGPTGMLLGTINPSRDSTPTLSHDSTSTIPRSLRLELERTDTARIDPLRHRVRVSMIVEDGRAYPLGRYMWGDHTTIIEAGGDRSSASLVDEMWIVDQESTETIAAAEDGEPVDQLIARVLENLPISARIDPSLGWTIGAWAPGTSQATILGELAVDGDYLQPWIDNDGVLRMRRAFGVSTTVPDLDWDQGNTIIADSITSTSGLLTAPNRYIVVSNTGTDDAPVIGQFDVPAAAPYSAASRGYVISRIVERQVSSRSSASSIAQTIWARNDLYETVSLTTVPDPRHDGHTTIRWRGDVWLETAWSMNLVEGGDMTHTIRRVYE